MKLIASILLIACAVGASANIEADANSIQCTMCKTLVSEVDKLVQDQHTIEEITSVLDGVCAKIPFLGDACKEIVDNNIADIINLIVAQADPDTICGAVGLCTDSEWNLALAQGLTATTWENCDSSSSLQATNVALSPDPPVAGQDCTTTITGKSSKDTTGGTVDIVIKYAGIPAKKVHDNVCDDIKGGCPIKAGDTVEAARAIALPGFSPKGKYTAQAIIKDESGAQTGCVNITFQLS